MRKDVLTVINLSSVALACIAPEARAAEFNWSGFYAGANLGARFGARDPDWRVAGSGPYDLYFQSGTPRFGSGVPFSTTSNSANFAPWSPQRDQAGPFLTGGVGAGYNWQWDRLVGGLEMDGSYLGSTVADAYRATESFNGGLFGTGAGTRNSYVKQSGGVDWLVTVRPRIGFSSNRVLLFGTGGLAVGGVRLTTTSALDEQYSDPGKGGGSYAATSRWLGKTSAVRAGFVVGGGAEYAFNDHFSMKLEGLYFNLGTASVASPGIGSYTNNGGSATALSVQPYTAKMLMDGTIVHLGFNWKM